MKPDYKNWVPKGMCIALWAGTIITLVLFAFFGILSIGISGITHTIIFGVTLLLFVSSFIATVYMQMLHNAFDYKGQRKLSKDVIEGIAKYVECQPNSRILDIGCGSGALAIAVAKRNKDSLVIGLDRWGKEYASYNKSLCENNAKCENVSNVTFEQGDACKLQFENESFDAVVSNYCIHNISSKNRQAILLESLRVLKKGGTFAIHDIFSKGKYGNMQSFINKLKMQGYESVELIDTTDKFMKKNEAKLLSLGSSALLYGKK